MAMPVLTMAASNGAQVAREASLHEAELAEAKQQGAGHYRALLQREGELSALQGVCDEHVTAKVPHASLSGMLRGLGRRTSYQQLL